MTVRVASFPPQRFGEVFCLGPGLGGLELLLQSPPVGGSLETLPEPFVRLADSGGVASTVVGRVASAGDTGQWVGVLLRSDGDAG
ncbi:MAG: hypothetical protein P1P84_16215, partial [Deferrisomatales bacterium]|nr:hypothetical protein [Deferrisomatales bacterium]